MARWVEFKKDFDFTPAAKPHSLVAYKAGTTRYLVAEAATKAVEGGFGVEVPSPGNRDEAEALKGSRNERGGAEHAGRDSAATEG